MIPLDGMLVTTVLAVRRRYTILTDVFLLSNCILNNFLWIARENCIFYKKS